MKDECVHQWEPMYPNQSPDELHLLWCSRCWRTKWSSSQDDRLNSGGCSVPRWVVAFLMYIDDELKRVTWNKTQNQEAWDESPFEDSGNVAGFVCDTFEVHAYDWGEDTPFRGPNFRWRGFEVEWYKHYRRDPVSNRTITPQEGVIMLNECISAIQYYDSHIGNQDKA